MHPTVSVIIPAYNAEKTIGLCLEAILKQADQSVEVIVVDDGSTDNTASSIRSFNRVTYIYQPNAGPASARNRGADASVGEKLFFTDSDCVPSQGWIKSMLPRFSDPIIGVVAGSYGIANPESMLARCIWQEIVFRHNRLMPDFPRAFGSYNFAIRKDIFKRLHGFDASFRRASGEDNDLSYKVSKLGYKICFERGSIVDHYHPTQVWKYLKEQYQHGFWRAKLYKNHAHMMKGDDYTFWKDIIEPVLCGTLVSFLLCNIFWHFAYMLATLSFGILLLIELWFGFKFIGVTLEGFFYGWVMFLRAISRFLGIASGFFTFFIKKIK
ncbi:MAG: glycosyltransferase [Candidatus Omnitrophica bacterium]|nr:glycosyltransferase [Candidatus Omnitrophota bacterium]